LPPTAGTAATALARLHSDPVPPRQVRASIPPDLEAITLKLLSRNPDGRHSNAQEVLVALQAAGTGTARSRTGYETSAARPVARPHQGYNSGGHHPPPVTDRTQVRSGEDLPAEPGTEPKNWVIPTLLILLTAVSLGIAGLLIGRSGGGLSDDDPPGIDPDEPAENSVDLEELSIARFQDYNPDGTGPEHPDRLVFINDDDSSQGWRTSLYNDKDIFGSARAGVGVYAELDDPADISDITILSRAIGWDADIYIADEPGNSIEDWGSSAHTLTDVGDGESPIEIELDEPVEGRYVLLFFTEGAGQVMGENGPEAVRNAGGAQRYAVEVIEFEVLGTPQE
jgi:eukaryotic-like serine/threonine-protein kinase